jgi:metallo-beta-lactamase class B
MLRSIARCIVLALTGVFSVVSIYAQQVKEPKPWSEEWAKPYAPFRIAGNLYYVGTYDLACYLITTPQGNILINTGLAASVTQIKENIKALGLKYADIKILLTTQAHYDHVGAMAVIKKQTGAQLMVHEKEAEVLKDGGHSDYALGGKGSSFKPVTPDRLLQDADTIQLGGMKLQLLHHPGHTKGSSSFLFTVNDGQRSYKVFIANMPSIVTDKPFEAISDYPEIKNDYAYTLKAMKDISFDIWLASHASQFNLHSKHKPGDAYNPSAFADRAGYDAALADLQQDYDKKLKQ